MAEADLSQRSPGRNVACAVEWSIYNLDAVLHLVDRFLIHYLGFYLRDVFIINGFADDLVLACCLCGFHIGGLYRGKVCDRQNLRGYSLVVRRGKLCAVLPVNFVSVILRRVVACGDVDTGSGVGRRDSNL